MGIARFLFLVLLSSAAFGQATAPPPDFEVASVKRMDPSSGAPGSNLMRGGPGTSDPGQITFTAVTMNRLLMAAYGVGPDQVSGPGWIDSERYAIAAKVPAGADKAAVRVMLQQLLLERFHLKLHRETKTSRAYELVVARNGPRLRPSVESVENAAPPASPSSAGLDKNGFPQPPPGRYAASMAGTVSRLAFRQFAISDLPKVLGLPLGAMAGTILSVAPVTDNTGLTGKYDFTLEFEGYMGPGGAFSPPPADGAGASAPNLFEALQTQLGLELKEKKIPIDILVIDHLDRVPAAN